MTTRHAEEILVEYGFLPGTSDAHVEAFVRACNEGLDEVVVAWLDLGMSPNAGVEAHHESSALRAAVEGGHLATVRLLLDRGANIEARDPSGDTPLRTALNWGHPDVARLLASRGADVEAVHESGESALDHAIGDEKDEHRDLLLELGADPNFCKHGRSPLRAAIARDVSAVRALLDAGASASRVLDDNGETALHRAVRQRDRDIVDLLVERGATYDARDAHGLTPLDHAFLVGDTKLLEHLARAGHEPSPQQRLRAELWSLVKDGALDQALAFLDEHDISIEVRNETHETLLMAFARNGHAAGVRRLLARGARPDAGNRTDDAVTRAVAAGHDEVLGLLLAAGAPPVDRTGAPAGLGDAVRGGHHDVVRRLLAACSPAQRARAAEQVIHAVTAHDAAMVTLLAELHVPLDHRSDTGETPLIAAVSDEHDLEVAQALLDGGADIHAATPEGGTPLSRHLGAHFWDDSHPPTLRLLLARGARLDTVHRSGSTPWAAARDDAKEAVVDELVTRPLQREVPVAELALRHSWATLPAVVHADRSDLVLALIDAGVAVNPPLNSPRDMVFQTVLHAAIEKQDVDLVRDLIARGADVNLAAPHESPLMVAASCESAEILTMLLDAGADPTWTNRTGHHALHWAIEAPQHLPLLLARGARCDDRVDTPLIKAASERSVEATRHLLEHGALVDARDGRGRTPLSVAISKGAEDVARLLIAAGASPTHMNRASGETPLTAAAKGGHVEIIKLLLASGASLGDRNRDGEDVRSLLLAQEALAAEFAELLATSA